MEWMTLSGGIPCLSLIALGTAYKGNYYISKDCLCEYTNSKFIKKSNGFLKLSTSQQIIQALTLKRKSI